VTTAHLFDAFGGFGCLVALVVLALCAQFSGNEPSGMTIAVGIVLFMVRLPVFRHLPGGISYDSRPPDH
jgi:hypothetical protein